MTEIENILTSTKGTIEGKVVTGRFYQIFTKKKYGKGAWELFNLNLVKNGYDRAKRYYRPLYNAKNSERIPKFDDIDWKPNLKTNTKGEVLFKVAKDAKDKGFLFSIQGFSKQGHLISQTIIKD